MSLAQSLVCLLALIGLGQVRAQLPNLRVGLPRDEDSLRYVHILPDERVCSAGSGSNPHALRVLRTGASTPRLDTRSNIVTCLLESASRCNSSECVVRSPK
jgi:hypothetical protein